MYAIRNKHHAKGKLEANNLIISGTCVLYTKVLLKLDDQERYKQENNFDKSLKIKKYGLKLIRKVIDREN